MRTHTTRVRVDERGASRPAARASPSASGSWTGRSSASRSAATRSPSAGPARRLARVYVEPTTLCNLLCRTCIRNVWDEPPGTMSAETFARIMDGVRGCRRARPSSSAGSASPSPTPTCWRCSPRRRRPAARSSSSRTGRMLDDATRRELVRIGLDRLWVSIDGATPESYADVRLWDALPQVIEDLAALRDLRLASRSAAAAARHRLRGDEAQHRRPARGDPPRAAAGRRPVLGQQRPGPHPRDARPGALRGLDRRRGRSSPRRGRRRSRCPGWTSTRGPSSELVRAEADRRGRTPAGRQGDGRANACPFVEKGSVSVRWDGAISPCLPLLHTHRSYLDFRPRTNHAFAVGERQRPGPARRRGTTPPTSRCASGSWPSTSPPARSATAATWPTRTSRTASAARPRPAAAASGPRGSSSVRRRVASDAPVRGLEPMICGLSVMRTAHLDRRRRCVLRCATWNLSARSPAA